MSSSSCDSTSGCHYSSLLSECLASAGRFTQTRPCPFQASSSACETAYLCDTNSTGYNQARCNTLQKTYCCGQGAMNNDTYCTTLKNTGAVNCAAVCPDFLPVNATACDPRMYGLWLEPGDQSSASYLYLSPTGSAHQDNGVRITGGPPRCNLTSGSFDLWLSVGAFVRVNFRVQGNETSFQFANPGRCTFSADSGWQVLNPGMELISLTHFPLHLFDSEFPSFVLFVVGTSCNTSPDVCSIIPECQVATVFQCAPLPTSPCFALTNSTCSNYVRPPSFEEKTRSKQEAKHPNPTPTQP